MQRFSRAKRIIFQIVFLLVSSSVFAASDQLKLAKNLIEQGQTTEAVEVMKEILETTIEVSKQAELEGAIGWALVTQNDYQGAEHYLELSLRKSIASKNDEVALRANNNLGIAYYLQNKFEDSRAYFKQDLAQNSETARSYLKLIDIKERELLGERALNSGVTKRHDKEFEEAIKQYDLSLKYVPDNPRTLELKGYALFRLDRLEEANTALLMAKAADPNRKFVHLNLLKVSCAIDSTSSIANIVDESGLDLSTYKQWYAVDGELRRVCADNKELSQLVSIN